MDSSTWNRTLLIAAVAFAGCGRVGFDALADGGGGGVPYQITVTIAGAGNGRVVSSPPAIDCPGTCTAEVTGAVALTASNDDATRFVTWSGACTGGNVECDLSPAGMDLTVTATFALQANRVFITDGVHDGNLGGLVGADAICQQEATTAGLVGTFMAFLSTPTIDAIDRFTGTNSRGWVRPDGAPVADTIDNLIAGVEFSPIVVDAHGTVVPPTQSLYIYTGSGGDGRQDINGTCQVWNSNSVGDDGGTAQSGSAPMVGIGGGAIPCNEAHQLFCFEIGRNVPVAPAPILAPGRTVFLSHAAASTGGYTGVGALDAICQNEAGAAALGGTYVAAVATTTASIATHVGSDARAFYRVDQSLVADSGADFFAGQLRGFVNQYADGTYEVFYGAFVAGSTNATSVGDAASTCNDWTLSAGGNPPLGIWSDTDGTAFWGLELSTDCSNSDPLLCVEQ